MEILDDVLNTDALVKLTSGITEDLKTETIKQYIRKQQETDRGTASSKVQAGLSQESSEKIADFALVTDLMAQLNESVNSNMYMNTVLSRETDKLGAMNSGAKTDIYKTQQRYLYTSYRIQYTKFLINFIIFTHIVTLLLMMLSGGWQSGTLPPWMFAIACTIILSLYIVITLVLFRITSLRRRDRWRQFYWKAGDSVVSAEDPAPKTECEKEKEKEEEDKKNNNTVT